MTGGVRPRWFLGIAGQAGHHKEKECNFRILQFVFHANCGFSRLRRLSRIRPSTMTSGGARPYDRPMTIVSDANGTAAATGVGFPEILVLSEAI